MTDRHSQRPDSLPPPHDPRFDPPSARPAGGADPRFDPPGTHPPELWPTLVVPDLGEDPYSHWQAEQPLRKRLGLAVLIAFFWCGLVSLFGCFALVPLARSIRAMAVYIAAPGVVLESRVKESQGDDSTTYAPYIRYSYQYDGRTLASERYSFDEFFTSDLDYAREAVQQHPPGKKVTVYLDPNDPTRSVLVRQVQGIVYFMLLFLQPFMLVGLALLGNLLVLPVCHRRVGKFLREPSHLPHLPWDIPTWGALEPQSDTLVIHTARKWLSLVFALGSGYMLVAFFAIFALVLIRGPSQVRIDDLRTVLLLGLGAGILMALATFRTRRAAVSIGWDNRTGRLKVESPTRTVDVPLADVRAFTIRGIRNPAQAKSNRDKAHAPLLLALMADGGEVPIHVFSADADGNYIAWKVTRELARLTGKTHQHPAPLPPAREGVDFTGVQGLKDLMTLARRAQKQAQQYRDLM